MISNTQGPGPVVSLHEPNDSPKGSDDRALPRDLRVALLEDILSLREHRIAHLERRIESLEDELAAKDERLEAQKRERRQMIDNYERILSERDENASSEPAKGPVATLQDLIEPARG